MGRVAEVGCIVCHLMGLGKTPAQCHHIGDTSERDDYLTIPLCPEHHTGKTGFHGMGERKFNATYKTNEVKLLGLTLKLMQ